MPENKQISKKNDLSADWLVRGILTKIGDTFDKLTGRGWKPSSSLATSELIEKLKKLMDLEVKDLGEKGKYVPHNFKLKMQWDKFSTDSETGLLSLQNELYTAAIDHINDNRYHTYAPVNIEVKPDYFTEGVQLLASFDKIAGETDEIAVKVTVPEMKVDQIIPPETKAETDIEEYIAEFTLNGLQKSVKLGFASGNRLSVGRSKENDLSIEDPSVSKIHASLVSNKSNQLMVADTGSTNGTFINNERIAYGKAYLVENGGKVKFGTVEVTFKNIPKPVLITVAPETVTENLNPVVIDGFEFIKKNETKEVIQETANTNESPAETENFGTEQRISFDFEKTEKDN